MDQISYFQNKSDYNWYTFLLARYTGKEDKKRKYIAIHTNKKQKQITKQEQELHNCVNQ